MRRRIAVILAVTGLCAAAAVPLASGRADAAQDSGTGCGTRTLYTPFTTLAADDNQYFLAQGADFETSPDAKGWFGAGVSLVPENEPWQVGGYTDAYSVKLDRTGATLSAPLMCVKVNEPTIRFFYKSPGTPGAKLAINMRTSSPMGASNKSFVLDGSRPGWQISPALTITDNTDLDGTQKLYLDFQSQGGSWLIDDVYVDPWKYNVK